MALVGGTLLIAMKLTVLPLQMMKLKLASYGSKRALCCRGDFFFQSAKMLKPLPQIEAFLGM